MPQLSPSFPLALRIDLGQLGEVPLQGKTCSLIIDENGGASVPDCPCDIAVNSLTIIINVKFVLPEIKAIRWRESRPLARISIRSSGGVALLSDKVEHFLALTEVGKVCAIVVEDP